MPLHPSKTLILAALRGSAFLSIFNALDVNQLEFLMSLEPHDRYGALQGILFVSQRQNELKRKEPEQSLITKIRHTLTDEQFAKVIPFLSSKDLQSYGEEKLRIIVSAIVLKYTSNVKWKEVDPNLPEIKISPQRYRQDNNLILNNIFKMLAKDYGMIFVNYPYLLESKVSPTPETKSPPPATQIVESRPENLAYYDWLNKEAEPVGELNEPSSPRLG